MTITLIFNIDRMTYDNHTDIYYWSYDLWQSHWYLILIILPMTIILIFVITHMTYDNQTDICYWSYAYVNQTDLYYWSYAYDNRTEFIIDHMTYHNQTDIDCCSYDLSQSNWYWLLFIWLWQSKWYLLLIIWAMTNKLIFIIDHMTDDQGWGADRSRVFLAPWSRSRLKKNKEPEPLGKKSQEPEPVKISRLLSPARR